MDPLCPHCGGPLRIIKGDMPKRVLTASEIIDHAKKVYPRLLTPESTAKLSVRELPTEFHLACPFFGIDQKGKEDFAKFAKGLEEIGAKWHSDRDRKEYYFIVAKS